MKNLGTNINGDPEGFSLAVQNFLVQTTDSYPGERFQTVVGPEIPRGCEKSFLLNGTFCSRSYKHLVDSAGGSILDESGQLLTSYWRVAPGTFFWAQILQKDPENRKTFVASKTKYIRSGQLEWTLWTNDPYFKGNLPGVDWKEIDKPTLIVPEVPNPKPEPAQKLDPDGLNKQVEEAYARMVQEFRGQVYCWGDCFDPLFLTPQGRFDPSRSTSFNQTDSSLQFYPVISADTVTSYPLPAGTLIGAALWKRDVPDNRYLAAKIKTSSGKLPYKADLCTNDREWVKKRSLEPWKRI